MRFIQPRANNILSSLQFLAYESDQSRNVLILRQLRRRPFQVLKKETSTPCVCVCVPFHSGTCIWFGHISCFSRRIDASERLGVNPLTSPPYHATTRLLVWKTTALPRGVERSTVERMRPRCHKQGTPDAQHSSTVQYSTTPLVASI